MTFEYVDFIFKGLVGDGVGVLHAVVVGELKVRVLCMKDNWNHLWKSRISRRRIFLSPSQPGIKKEVQFLLFGLVDINDASV